MNKKDEKRSIVYIGGVLSGMAIMLLMMVARLLLWA